MPESEDTIPTTNAISQALASKNPKESKDQPKKEPAKSRAPFPPKTRVRYTGNQRLFAGWQCTPVMEPGMEYEVSEVAGPYSVVVADINGSKYPLVITEASRLDWSIITAG